MTSSARRNERNCTPRLIALWMIPKRDVAWTLGSTSSSIGRVVKLVLLDEAQRRFEEEDAWWRKHRDEEELQRDLIEVHSVWGARRKRGPRLR